MVSFWCGLASSNVRCSTCSNICESSDNSFRHCTSQACMISLMNMWTGDHFFGTLSRACPCIRKKKHFGWGGPKSMILFWKRLSIYQLRSQTKYKQGRSPQKIKYLIFFYCLSGPVVVFAVREQTTTMPKPTVCPNQEAFPTTPPSCNYSSEELHSIWYRATDGLVDWIRRESNNRETVLFCSGVAPCLFGF